MEKLIGSHRLPASLHVACFLGCKGEKLALYVQLTQLPVLALPHTVDCQTVSLCSNP